LSKGAQRGVERMLYISLAAAVLFAPASAAPTLELVDCRINAGPAYPGISARCGMLERPLNPADASSPALRLRVAVVPALSLEPEPDPFVPIAGGPGQGTVEFYAGTARAFEKIRRNRDLVLLDQRGTGDSARMDCDVEDELVGGAYSEEETRAATRECLAALPFDPRYFTTSVAVTDLEALRQALGYERLNLYGVSYGSRVAQHFARRYPGSTRSVILDGVVPPQLALGPGIAVEAQKALDAIFARCADDEACNERFPGLAAGFEALRESLDAEPRILTLPHPLTGQPEVLSFAAAELAGAVRLLSYNPASVALLPFLLQEAIDGRLEPIAAQFLMIRDGMTDALALGMHNAVMCTEDAPYFGGEAISDEELAATYIGPLMLAALRQICAVWPAGLIDDGFKTPLDSDLPVLLLSGDADPVTPPYFAEMAAVDLANAALLVGRNQGHGQAQRGCVPDIMAEFVATADPSAPDTDCLAQAFAMPFFLGYSGPAP